MRLYYFFCLLSVLEADLVDLEEKKQPFVLETKQIEIPGYPFAFNPSLIRWRGYLLLSFRVILDPKNSFNSEIGVVFLDETFSPASTPQLLQLRDDTSLSACRAEDARLILVEDQLYIVYSDNTESKVSRGGFRVYLAELHFNGEKFRVENREGLFFFEGESAKVREKNWTPFVYQDELLLAYSLSPHRIFRPLLGTQSCETLFQTDQKIEWDFGELRGGTPALLEEGQYLAFFHSSKEMQTSHSEGKKISHYFIGAYTFSASPPFSITHISPEPIIGPGFYEGIFYKPYWKPIRVVFPCGYISEKGMIYLAYGRQDHEVWIATLDKQALLQSLVPVE